MAEGGKKLNLDMFAKPMGSEETSQGTVYAYSPSTDNYKFYSDLSEETPENRAQKVLPILISMIARTSFSEDVTPIPLDIYSNLSEPDLSAIVDLFNTKLGAYKGKHSEKSGGALESSAKFHPHCSPKCIPNYSEVARHTNQQFQVLYSRIAW